MPTLRQIGDAEYELDYGTMRFGLRCDAGRLRATGGGSSRDPIDDIDWDEYVEQAEIQANELLPELAVFDTPDLVVLPHVLSVCDTELMNWIAHHPQELGRVDSRVFEEIIAAILKTFGFEVQLTPQTRDGGYDILAVKKDIIGIKTHYIVECKHPSKTQKVGVVPVRTLYGVKEKTRAEHAILVTDYRFTRDAWEFANDPHVWNLHLKDKDALVEWLDEYRRQKTL